jgi:hypothetical protein
VTVRERRYSNVDAVYEYAIRCPQCGLSMGGPVGCWTLEVGKTSEECRAARVVEARAELLAAWNRRVETVEAGSVRVEPHPEPEAAKTLPEHPYRPHGHREE